MAEVKGGVSAPDSLGWASLEIPIDGIKKDQWRVQVVLTRISSVILINPPDANIETNAYQAWHNSITTSNC